MTRVCIMAAGSQSRWRTEDGQLYGGTPKHLAAPTGEPLLTRLCRQLEERGLTDVVLLGPQEYGEYVPSHVRMVTPNVLADTDEWLGATKFANTSGYWSTSGRTIIFYGDIWLDDEVVDAIVNDTEQSWLNWSRLGRSPLGKAGENFAVSFYPEHREHYLETMRLTAQTHREGIISRSGGWEILRAMGGLRGREIRKGPRDLPMNRDVGHLGSGFSDDFDYGPDLDKWVKHYRPRPKFDLGPTLPDRLPYSLLRHCLNTLDIKGVAVEFGVGSGKTTRLIAERMPVFGFGSTKGLPEDWRPGFQKGRFAYPLPNVPNAHLFDGLFEETLPKFDFTQLGHIGLVHMDADLYSATACALKHVGPHLEPGCVVVFDEFHGFPGFENHEERAWAEYVKATGQQWDVIGHTTEQWAIRLT